MRADLDAPTWGGTGRVQRVGMWPMTTAERLGLRTRPLLDRVVGHGSLNPPRQGVDLRGCVELALSSGFPEAVFAGSERAEQRWLESYMEQLLTRDAVDLESGRDAVRLRRYFEALALNSAGAVEEKELYDAAGIDRRTAVAYERLLSNLLVVDSLPA